MHIEDFLIHTNGQVVFKFQEMFPTVNRVVSSVFTHSRFCFYTLSQHHISLQPGTPSIKTQFDPLRLNIFPPLWFLGSRTELVIQAVWNITAATIFDFWLLELTEQLSDCYLCTFPWETKWMHSTFELHVLQCWTLFSIDHMNKTSHLVAAGCAGSGEEFRWSAAGGS